ncbi:MAG: hypothetical protein HC922_02520 [Leptolyngbyaceae cyanobacterium SM2_3_12]|nr:hypothetical protein [Leptolyngbyaceae cyanobacterium SM2_3_12]
MSNRLSRLTLISSASPLADLSSAMAKIQGKDGHCLEVLPFFTHQLQDPDFLPETLLNQVRQSDAVLFDLRGNPDRAVSLVQRALAETDGEDIAFIPVFGGGPSILALTRMGDFSMAGMTTSRPNSNRPGSGDGKGRPAEGTDYRKLKQAGQSIEPMVSSLPPHLHRHAKNWATCMQYWSNSGADNLANLFRFVAREYGGLNRY